ncbi:unnamed protein product, partial [Nesidiocoris tenuis]
MDDQSAKRFKSLEDRQGKMETLLEQILQNMTQREPSVAFDEENSEFGDSDGESQSSLPCSPPRWQPPDLMGDSTQAISFPPAVQVQGPSIPDPESDINEQGISCQRIGSSGWNQ